MSTANKLTYLNDTKQELKQKINNLGGDITDQTTFRQYADKLQNVYDNAPKTDYAEGSNITLSNTLKGKLDFEDGIVGIGDTKQTQYKGYNLFHYTLASLKTLNTTGTWNDNKYTLNGLTFTVNNDLTISVSGTSTANTDFILEYKAYTNGTTYTIWDGQSDNAYGKYSLLIASYSYWGANTFITDISNTFTAQSNQSIRTGISVYNNNTLSNVVFKPMLYLGNYDSTKDYEPYTGGQASPNPSYPQTINSVTGNQDVVVSGINKLPPIFDRNITRGNLTVTKNNDGTYTLNGSVGSTDEYIQGINISSYGIKGKKLICMPSNWSSSNGYATPRYTDSTWGGTDIGSGTSVDSTKTVAFIALLLKANSTFDNVILKPMIADDTSATYNTYEPYITPTSYQLSLGDIELNAIGNYKDELIYDVENDRVYKNEKIVKVVFNGTEGGWSRDGLQSGLSYYSFYNTENVNLFLPSGVVVCDKLVNNTTIYSTDTQGIYCNYGSAIRIKVLNNTLVDVPTLKTWLGTNNLLVYCPRKTPIEIPITDTTLVNQVKALYNAHSNNGTTIIEINGQLPLIIKVRALKGE